MEKQLVGLQESDSKCCRPVPDAAPVTVGPQAPWSRESPHGCLLSCPVGLADLGCQSSEQGPAALWGLQTWATQNITVLGAAAVCK